MISIVYRIVNTYRGYFSLFSISLSHATQKEPFSSRNAKLLLILGLIGKEAASLFSEVPGQILLSSSGLILDAISQGVHAHM